jgi:hypothetical protein
VRTTQDGPLEAVLVLGAAAPSAGRATVVRPEPFASRDHAAAWLAALKGNEEGLEAEARAALRVLNRALRAQRLAAADPYAAELSAGRATTVRVGFGRGDALADGRYEEAVEVPRARRRRVKRSMEAPEERFAALLGARERALVAEDLVLRARADLDAEHPREAALQARVALEALLAERPGAGAGEHRGAVGAAANAALADDLDAATTEALAAAIEAMEAELRRHRLGG